MRDSLLWVYEGQTEFWGLFLSARSGLLTRQEVLDLLALDAATAEAHCGREWKSLRDSNNDPIFDVGHSVPWRDWERREDYYAEGVLLWLDVDSLIRKQTAGQKSLEDFARVFFGESDGSPVTETYTFDDVCRALSGVTVYDWARFLQERLDAHTSAHLLDGLTRAGYRLVYTTNPTAAYRQQELDGSVTDLWYSIGLTVDERGVIRAVAWNQPAFRAGLVMGARILAINGIPFSTTKLCEALVNADKTPIHIVYTVNGSQHNASVDYRGTLRYPQLERISGTADLISPLFG
jgi:predicted metalloprotease with PDZ domain